MVERDWIPYVHLLRVSVHITSLSGTLRRLGEKVMIDTLGFVTELRRDRVKDIVISPLLIVY